MTKTTERQRQLEAPGEKRLFQYRCSDGELFEAYAVTESGAFRVLNAERPGMRAIRVARPRQTDPLGNPIEDLSFFACPKKAT